MPHLCPGVGINEMTMLWMKRSDKWFSLFTVPGPGAWWKSLMISASMATDRPNLRQTGRDGGNIKMERVIVSKLTDITRLFVCHNEANSYYVTFIRCLIHPVACASHSVMPKLVRIKFPNALIPRVLFEFWESDQRISLHRKTAGSEISSQKVTILICSRVKSMINLQQTF